MHILSLPPLGKLGLVQVKWARFQESEGQHAQHLEVQTWQIYSNILLVKANYKASLDSREGKSLHFFGDTGP